MKITACSIVKNEEKNIARSIESYKSAVDEIIIVDTGSTDNTVEICKEYGATTLFYEWNNDFSVAKNYALEHAKGDWIIFLDADEWFSPKITGKVIANVLKQIDNVADGLMTTMCQYNDKTNRVFARELTTRIFRNSPRIRYCGNIHERLKNRNNELTQAHCPDIEIFHSGYANEFEENKTQRNLDILYNEYNQGRVNTHLYFYIFRENYILGNLAEAIKFYELFIKQEDVDKVIQNDGAIICIYELMYRIMVKTPEKYNQQDIYNLLEEAYKKYPKLPIHSYMLGCEKLKTNDYCESYDWLCKSIKLNNQYSEPFSNVFVGLIADTYYKLGYISQEQGKLEQALSNYMEAIKGASTSEQAAILPKLISIIEAQPEEEIILFLNSLLDMKKKESVEAVLGVLKQTRLHKAFVYYAIKYNQEFDGQDETTYLAMILTGQAEQAIETAIAASENESSELYDGKLGGKIRDGGDANHENWQMDYAVVAILYSKSSELFEKYREHFNPVQREIIEAYLGDRKVIKVTEELRREHNKINNQIFYIFEESDMDKLRNCIIV